MGKLRLQTCTVTCFVAYHTVVKCDGFKILADLSKNYFWQIEIWQISCGELFTRSTIRVMEVFRVDI